MKMPNKTKSLAQTKGPLFKGVLSLFCINFEFGKNANSALVDAKVFLLCYLSFVWRQLELAFFGAATSVAALFICAGIYFLGEEK